MMDTNEPRRDQDFSYADDPLWGGAAAGQRAHGPRDERVETPAEKRPLFRELPPAPTFPMEALGALRPAADAVRALTQAPPAMCGLSVLAAASLATCAHFDAVLLTGQRRPTAIIGVTVAASGERKTTVDGLATAAIRTYENELASRDEPARQAFWRDHEAWKSAVEHAKKMAKKGGRAAIRDALEEIGAEPKPPPMPMVITNDPTPESLTLALADGRPFLGIFADEGGSVLGGHSFTDEAKMRTIALLNSLWDGGPIRRLRVITGARFAPGRRLAAHLMVQPLAAERLLSDALASDMGLTARTLIVAPDSTAGSRLWCEPDPAARQTLQDYDVALLAMLRKPPRMADAGALDPVPLPLSAAAKARMVQFHDAAERQMRRDGALAPIRAFGAKMAEHATRLAAVIAAFDDPECGEISLEAAACGQALAEHFAAELLRLGQGAQIAPDLRRAGRVLEWWQSLPSAAIYPSQIYVRGVAGITDAAGARQALTILADHGWARPLKENSIIAGKRRKEAWALIP